MPGNNDPGRMAFVAQIQGLERQVQDLAMQQQRLWASVLQLASSGKTQVTFGALVLEWPGGTPISGTVLVKELPSCTTLQVYMMPIGSFVTEITSAGTTAFEVRGVVTPAENPPAGTKRTVRFIAISIG